MFVQQFRRDFLVEMNRTRAEARACGMRMYRAARPVAYNEKLNSASQLYAQDMAARGFFSHTSPEGQGVRERLKNVQYRSCTWAENIAWGKADARRVVEMWVNSPGHCANLMNANFDEIGFGVKEGNAPGTQRKTLYFTLNLGRTGHCLNLIEPEIIAPEIIEPSPTPVPSASPASDSNPA